MLLASHNLPSISCSEKAKLQGWPTGALVLGHALGAGGQVPLPVQTSQLLLFNPGG